MSGFDVGVLFEKRIFRCTEILKAVVRIKKFR